MGSVGRSESLGGNELIAFLRSLGASDEQIETAERHCDLSRLPTDLVLNQGVRFNADELALRAGVDVQVVLELWRMLGIAVPDNGHPMFSERTRSSRTWPCSSSPLAPTPVSCSASSGVRWRTRRRSRRLPLCANGGTNPRRTRRRRAGVGQGVGTGHIDGTRARRLYGNDLCPPSPRCHRPSANCPDGSVRAISVQARSRFRGPGGIHPAVAARHSLGPVAAHRRLRSAAPSMSPPPIRVASSSTSETR